MANLSVQSSQFSTSKRKFWTKVLPNRLLLLNRNL